jgi:hypothetical protein
MADNDLTTREERRGTRRVLAWGAAIAIVLGIAVVVWPLLPGGGNTGRQEASNQAAGPRFDQPKGESTAGTTTQPPAGADTSSPSRETVGRAEHINETARTSLSLSQDQIDAIKTFAAQRSGERADTVDFTVSIGSAVPQQAQLRDIPDTLAEAVPNYRDNQYAIVGDRFVVVEKQTRRIVAIVPLQG